MKNVTRSVRFVLSMVLVMAMVLTSIGSLGTVAKAETGKAADGLKGLYRIYHTEDETQRMAPGGNQASEGNNLWLWEQEANAPADCEMFYFEQAEDGSYYWYNKQDAQLVMQADTSAVSLQRKNAASANQKWTIEKVAGTEDQYYLKNGSRYASTSANRHAQVSMSDTAQAWRLAKVEPEVKLSLGSSTIRTGESTTAAVTGFDADGAELDGSKAVLTSENPDIAEVSGNTVIAKKAGTATIKAAFEGKEVSTELTVLEAAKEWPGVYRIDNVEFAGYLIEPGADNVSEGNNLYLWNTALAQTRMWEFTDAGDGYVYWHPRNNVSLVIQGGDLDSYPSMAKNTGDDTQKWKIIKDETSGNYRIQNKASGKYVATANDANQQLIQMKEESAKTSLWIINELKASISLEVSASYLQTGKTTNFAAIAKDASGAVISSGIRTVSSNPEVASLEGNQIKGLKAGHADITSYLTAGGKEYTSNTIRVYVTDEAPVFTGKEWYKDISTAEVNREPSHADFVPYQDADTAFNSEKSALDDQNETASTYYKLLTQKEWDFALVENPEKADAADAKGYLEETLPEEAKADFQKEFVPHAWQTYRNADKTFKYFDEAIYTNSIYPWGSAQGNTIEYDDPQAPTHYNPVGYYRTEFELPENWDGREVFLSLQSVRSAYYLFINGKQVGYTADSFTAHDFNITPYLNKNGKNTIALKVYRWGIGSYLENQDFIQLSGIMRDIYLYSKDSRAELRDFFVQTSFADRTDKNSDVTMKVDVAVRNLTDKEDTSGYTVDVKLKDMDGKVIGQDTISYDKLKALQGVTGASDPNAADADGEKKVNLGDRKTATIEVKNPKKWFPDTPNLYMVTLELKDSTGKVIEAEAEHVGFREIYKVNINDAEQEQMQITGQKIIFRGVNRHDTSLENGSAVTNQEIIDDLKLMKQYNVNAVRTSHYPNAKILYDLADELGIYVYAEANVESHYGAYGDHKVPIPGGDSRWVTPVVDRNMNMLELLKNHASIIGWSYGNEATYTRCPLDNTYCFWAAAMAVLNRDPSRLRMYERESDGYYHRYQKDAGADPWGMETRSKNIVDVHSTQYPEAKNVESYAKNTNNKLPYFEQEYEHAMGQSFGSFNEFWKLNRTYANVQGGFIWDWADQSLATTREDGKTFWAYGGDWMDASSNADAFCANGVLFADHTPSAKAVQMRYDHQQVNFYLENEDAKVTDGTIKVKVVNELENSTLENYNIIWSLKKDDKEIATKTISLNAPGMDGETFGEEVITIELPKVQPQTGDTYMLEFSVQNKVKPDWDATLTKYDNVVAHEQFDLTPEYKEKQTLDYNAMAEFTKAEDDGNTLSIEGVTKEGKTYSLKMDKATGILSDYTVDGKVVLEKGPVPSFWRAQNYNDTPIAYNRNLRNTDDNMELVDSPVITQDENRKHIRVALNVKLPVDAEQTLLYDIYGDGEIVVRSAFTPRSNFAPGTAGAQALPKVGVRMTVAAGYENLEYFGRGPEENYIDRKTATDVGVYKSTVTDQFVSKYVKPQENGNHTDVRWTSLTDNDGNGILVAADGTVESSALHVKAENINPVSWTDYPYNNQTIRHSTEVPMDEQTYLCLDAIQRGVSNTGFFNHVPLEGFYPTTKQNADGSYNTYAERFRIVPVTSETDKMEESKAGFEASSAAGELEEIKNQAVAAKNDAETAAKAAEAAKADAEAAKAKAEEVKAAAEEAKKAAEEAKAAADVDKAAAEAAQAKAEVAQKAAETAEAEAQKAQTASEAAQAKAEAAQKAAKEAEDAAKNYANDAEAAKTAAEAAKTTAENAKKDAETAAKAAEAAKDSVSAQKDLAEAAAGAAKASADAAKAAQANAEAAAKAAEEAQKKAEEILAKAQKEAEEKRAEAQKQLEEVQAMQKRLESQLAKTEFAAKKVKVKAVKGVKKSVKVNWKSVEGADGYVIEYAKKANFKGKKTVTVSASRKAKTIKRLSAKKTYYVRVKAYKVVDNEKVYTAYSAKKKVRTK